MSVNYRSKEENISNFKKVIYNPDEDEDVDIVHADFPTKKIKINGIVPAAGGGVVDPLDIGTINCNTALNMANGGLNVQAVGAGRNTVANLNATSLTATGGAIVNGDMALNGALSVTSQSLSVFNGSITFNDIPGAGIEGKITCPNIISTDSGFDKGIKTNQLQSDKTIVGIPTATQFSVDMTSAQQDASANLRDGILTMNTAANTTDGTGTRVIFKNDQTIVSAGVGVETEEYKRVQVINQTNTIFGKPTGKLILNPIVGGALPNPFVNVAWSEEYYQVIKRDVASPTPNFSLPLYNQVVAPAGQPQGLGQVLIGAISQSQLVGGDGSELGFISMYPKNDGSTAEMITWNNGLSPADGQGAKQSFRGSPFSQTINRWRVIIEQIPDTVIVDLNGNTVLKGYSAYADICLQDPVANQLTMHQQRRKNDYENVEKTRKLRKHVKNGSCVY